VDLLGTARTVNLVAWYENTGNPREVPWPRHDIDRTSVQPGHGHPVDLDGDGDLDVIMAFGMRAEPGQANTNQAAWYENVGSPGKGTEWKKHVIGTLEYGFEVVAGDLDNDGDLDLVGTGCYRPTPGDVSWFENPGDPKGPWEKHILKSDWCEANQVIVADLDSDGRLDIAVTACNPANEFRWWRNLGPRQAALSEEETTMQDRCHQEQFTVSVSERQFTVTALSPPTDKLADDPCLLLTFGQDQSIALFSEPYSLCANAFLERGHRVLSFDMPAHGQRIDHYGKWMEGWRNAFMAGADPFTVFVEDGRAVISECIDRGWVKPGRIAVAGPSRCGYMVLRLLAADDRIAAGAGLAPVTDLRYIREFAGVPRVSGLRLTRFVEGMVGKNIYLAIGNQDERVNTESCRRLSRALVRANEKAGYDESYVELHITNDEGHRLGDASYAHGAESLLKWMCGQ